MVRVALNLADCYHSIDCFVPSDVDIPCFQVKYTRNHVENGESAHTFRAGAETPGSEGQGE